MTPRSRWAAVDVSSWGALGVMLKRLDQVLNAVVGYKDEFRTLTYGVTIVTDAVAAHVLETIVTNGVGFTFSAPLNGTDGQELEYLVYNNSGGAMGVITWAAPFHLAGAFVNPANGQQRSITFTKRGAVWGEKCRTAADQAR